MDNLFVFHGADHKCGTTMMAQSVAELMADSNKEVNVLLISLNGRKSTEYVRENIDSIDNFKLRLDSGIPVEKRLLIKNKKKENLYMIAGIERELEERYYMPETAARLMENLAEQFDAIIADTGSELDNGLAVGGLSLAEKNFLVLTQNEAIVKRYETMRQIYQRAGVDFDQYIVNKHCEKDIYSLGYISDRLEIDKEKFLKVEMASYGRQAEMEYRTLLEYGVDKYIEDILKIANVIGGSLGLPAFRLKRKSIWKNFI